MTASQLVPVVPGTIGNVQCLTVDGRSLHNVLRVRRDFSNWIKGRISKYGFVAGQDFEVFAKTGENPDGGRPSQEYCLTVGMGKELCMVENNEQGRVARRYFIECERRLLSDTSSLESSVPSPISKRTDPERKQLTAIINTWVGMAPIHYANARAQVNAHFGVTGVDKLTVAQVKEAIAWVQAKIDALPPAPEQLALTTPKKDKFEAYIEQVEEFRARTDAEIRRLLQDGLRLVDVYKFGPKAITGFSGIFLTWLHEVAVSPSPLVAHYWSMDRAIEYSPLYLIREMEKILPDYRRG